MNLIITTKRPYFMEEFVVVFRYSPQNFHNTAASVTHIRALFNMDTVTTCTRRSLNCKIYLLLNEAVLVNHTQGRRCAGVENRYNIAVWGNPILLHPRYTVCL